MRQPTVASEGDLRSSASTAELTPPNGLQEILAAFGNIHDYIQSDGGLDPRWQTAFLSRAVLPFPLLLSWDHSKTISQFQCHQRLVGKFQEIFAQIQARGQPNVRSFGGCFAYRAQRTGTKLSTHSWGIAIDLNPETNLQGSAGDMDAGVIEIFHAAGFKWGGAWEGKSKDPMHFQFCTGY
jgi:hypothetical protein